LPEQSEDARHLRRPAIHRSGFDRRRLPEKTNKVLVDDSGIRARFARVLSAARR
jgi:hypothetical protein